MTSADRSATLAETIVFAAFKIVLPTAESRITAVKDIVDALAGADADRLTRRDISRQLEASIDKLSARLASFAEQEFRGLDEGDKTAAILGVCAAIEKLHLTKQAVIDDDVNADSIYARIKPAAHQEWAKAYISEGGTEYGRVFLVEASRFIVNIVRDLPDFTQDLGIATLTIARRTLQLLQHNIDSVVLPSFRAGTEMEAATFEADYRSDVIQRNKDVELFGVNIPIPELRRQPLDIAYITLSATSKENLRGIAQSTNVDVTLEQRSYHGSVDQAISAVIRKEAAAHGAVQSSTIRPANTRTGARILVTGPAGSGKTTLVQWLALRSAEGGFTGNLAQWNASLPYVLKLRNLFRGGVDEIPDDVALIEAAVNRGSSMPGDWIANCLDHNNVILMLDGLDELPEYHQSTVRVWLERFIGKHASVNVLVTSRPEGIDHRWFASHGFTSLALESMALNSIETCVSAWFKAVASVAPDMRDALTTHERSLMHDVRNRAAVRELAETPLVCAMLCAFYAYEMSESSPDSRGELYERVIDALVDKRDRSRSAIDRDRRRFTSGEKLTLLQAIARYLTEQQMLVLSTGLGPTIQRPGGLARGKETALSIVEREADGLATLSLSSRDALDHLLKRSVIFREVAPDEAQFAHRSIQEFLTARSFAKTGQIDALLKHLGSEEWNRIIAFAANMLDSRWSTHLVRVILERTEIARENKRELLLLVAECLSTTPVDPDVVRMASSALADILPPRSMREAELLGRSGEGVVRWLSNYKEASEDTVEACLHAAAVTGSQSGLAVIVEYAPYIRSARLKHSLLDAWQYFDAEEYAEAVLARLPLDEVVVALTNSESLGVAHLIDGLREVAIDVDAGVVDFRRWARLRALRQIDCSKFRSLVSLSGIATIPGLRRLDLSNKSGIRDFSEIGLCENLVDLNLDACSGLADASFLADLAKLRSLSLERCTGLTDFDWLSDLSGLLMLSLNGCSLDSLAFIANMRRLQHLRLATISGWDDVSALRACSSLRRLDLSLAHERSIPLRLPEELKLRALKLSGSVKSNDLLAVVKFVALEEFAAGGIDGLHDLRPLGALRSLRSLKLPDCRGLVSCKGIESFPELRVLELAGSAIRYPEIPHSLRYLERVSLERCANLGGIEDIVSLPSLKVLVLPPIDSTVLSEMARRAANPSLEILCDPIPGGYETG